MLLLMMMMTSWNDAYLIRTNIPGSNDTSIGTIDKRSNKCATVNVKGVSIWGHLLIIILISICICWPVQTKWNWIVGAINLGQIQLNLKP